MAQMNWNKYPEVIPPANDIYLVVFEFKICNGSGVLMRIDRSVSSATFDPEENRWYYENYDPEFDCLARCDFDNVVYWMPYPEAPKD